MIVMTMKYYLLLLILLLLKWLLYDSDNTIDNTMTIMIY